MGGAGAGVLAAVLASGVFIGIFELGDRNFCGKFSVGKGTPAGMGATISGVTITISSVFALFLWIDWKNLPRTGMSPRKGILLKVSDSVLSSRPPMMKL